jgi:hypothetical protein
MTPARIFSMLDDGPTDVALQEYKNKIINTLEEIITDLMNPIIK